MKIWIKFKQAWVQKSKDKDGKEQTKEFKVGDIIQVDEEISKSLVQLGFAEKTEAPKGDDNFDEIVKGFQGQISSVIDKALEASIARINKALEDNLPITSGSTKKNELRGFEDEDHFFKSILSVTPNAPTYEVGKGLELLTKAPSGQNISNDPEGGYLVPEPISDRIWTNMQDVPTSVFPETLKFRTAGNSLKVPRVFESSRAIGTGQRYAGVRTYWVDEADAITSSKFTTGRMNLELHKLAALVYATDEMLDDSGGSAVSLIDQLVPKAIADAVGESFFIGTGVGMPKGALVSDSLIIVAKESGQANSSIFHNNVNKMYWRNIYRSRARWFMHADIARQLEFMYFADDSTNKRPVYVPANLTGTPFATLYGRPVVPLEYMKSAGKQGDVLFGYFGDYATLTKVGAGRGLKRATSIHVRFLYDELAFRFTFRIDGRDLWTGPKTDRNGSTTRSPFVTLGNRTATPSSSGL